MLQLDFLYKNNTYDYNYIQIYLLSKEVFVSLKRNIIIKCEKGTKIQKYKLKKDYVPSQM